MLTFTKLALHQIKKNKIKLFFNSAYKAQELLGVFTEAEHFGINKHTTLVYLKLSFQTASHCLVHAELKFQNVIFDDLHNLIVAGF